MIRIHDRSGVTVIEIIIVVVIIGILTAAGMPAFTKLTNGWLNAGCLENRRRMVMVMQAEQARHPGTGLLELDEYMSEYRLDCPAGGTWVLHDEDGTMSVSCNRCDYPR